MKETKRCIVQYSFYDRTGIVEYLKDKARHGWRLERISQFGWIFRRIDPGELHYEVTYFPAASAFDPEPSEKQQAFQEFCAHTGWELAAANGQLQIFYNERSNPTPIETDAVLEVETIHKAVKKGYLPGNLLLMAVGVLQAALFSYRLSLDPIGILAGTTNLFTGFCWFMVLLLTTVDLANYFRWHRRARRAAERDGSFMETKSLLGFHLAVLGIMLTAMVGMLLSMGNSRMWIVFVVALGIMVLCVVLCVAFSNWMKRKKASARLNRTLTLGASVLLGIGISGVMLIVIIGGIHRGWLEKEAPDSYVYNGWVYPAYDDELPLTVEDLMGRTGRDKEKYSYQWFAQESLLMGQFEAYQNPRKDHLGEPGMQYTVLRIRWSMLYDWFLKHLLAPKDSRSEDIYGNIFYDTYLAVDPQPWGAVEAYRLHRGEYAKDQYLICYEDRIVEIDVDWEMTEEQMGMVGEKLNKR